MLRPERMSRVSVTGSRRVMDEAIEVLHELNLFDVTDYDGAWEGFEPGDPVEGADAASEKLVTARALQSTLGVTDEDAGPTRIVTEEALAEDLEEVRTTVNEHDDERNDVESELRHVEERLAAVRPLVDLDIDLDLLSGYDNLSVSVGEGDEASVRQALSDADDVAEYEVYTGEEAVAAFAYPADASLDDALVGADFTSIEVPDADGDPAEYVSQLRNREQQLESKLASVESELATLRREYGGFLLAAEEKLAIEAQQREAPLSFATTENAFVAEGWLPTEEFVDLAEALSDAVGDHVDVEELERADYRDREFVGDHDDHDDANESVGRDADAVAADGGSSVSGGDVETDGGDKVMSRGEPPTRQDNPKGVRPFQLLTQAVGKPKYTELDPTIILFFTFPLMFGFMIGDVGYGVIYTAIGLWVIGNFDSDTFRDFGKVAAAAGIMTVVFGVLYGEIFGLHMSTLPVTADLYPHPVIEKGLSPATKHWAQAWFVVTALFGVAHLNVAWTFEFIEEYTFHGFVAALEEVGSWLLALNGLWLFVFSRLFEGNKPELLFTVFDTGEQAAFELGFSGLPAWTGWVGIGAVAVGLFLLLVGPTHEIVEAHQVLAHVLSYLRIGAVLLAKAGMAFAVNLLFFGAYETHGEYHYMLFHGPTYVAEHHPDATIMFGGMAHGGPALLLVGILVLLVGHLVVLLLGITSAGIQSIRLEYFEFFSKFYDGSGKRYDPFGYERRFTTED